MENESSKRHLLFVINPIAGDVEKDELDEEINETCTQHNISFDIYKTSGENDEEEIKKLLESNKYDGVFAVGGDGTVNIVGTLLIGTSVPLGIIPLGSGNGLSKDLNIPQDTEEALELIHNYTIRSIDTITLNGVSSIHLSDLGFNALVVKRFCEEGTRGPGSYAWIAMQEYLSYTPKHYKIETDAENFEGEAFMVTIANANAFGSNANINPNGILNDGKFEICLIEPFPKTAGIGILYKLYTDSIDDSVFTRRISCKKAIIHNIDNELLHIDGEPVDLGKDIKVEMHSKSLKVILPVPEED
jgi:diacylglycerol kinase (ATP)